MHDYETIVASKKSTSIRMGEEDDVNSKNHLNDLVSYINIQPLKF
jgi:hypothetical protein